MTADLGELRHALQRELQAGCSDDAVDGGLDELLRRQAIGEQPGSPLLRMVGALPEHGYRALDADGRRVWVRRALATIAQEQRSGGPRAPRARGGGARSPRANGRAPQPPRPRGGAARSTERGRGAPAERAAVAAAAAPSRSARGKLPPGAAALDLPLRAAGTGLRANTLARLERLGLRVVGDALRHYPRRHHDFSQTVPVTELRVGTEQTVRGTIARVREVRMGRGGRMRSTEMTVVDEAGASIRVVWFNQPYLAKQFEVDSQIAISGTVHAYRGRPTFDNPEFERVGDPQTHTGRMVPVYPLTDGLPQRTLRTLIAGLLERFADRLADPLPAEVRERHDLLGVVEATRQIHYPDSAEQLAAARRRLAFDELLAIQLAVHARKRDWEQSGDAAAIDGRAAAGAFLERLPYTLTGAQRRALDDVLGDLQRPVPMARLMEGDVGSGKTVVALAAMLAAVDAGYQAVLMAPTEVLAEQHYRTICTLLSGEPEPPLGGLVSLPYLALPLRIVLLTGSTRTKERRDALESIRHGGAQIVLGTHALIEKGVEFHRLGFAIVDEQHRFGVMQRAELREKGTNGAGATERPLVPHLLVMTATPIPRSLALTAYGDLELTVIDEMPPGRTPIETRWLPPDRRSEAFEHVRREVEAGRQVFVICPLVEGSETVASRAATEEFERLQTQEFPDLADRIELLHGRMSGRKKDAVMLRFASGEVAVLVSTAVVEVGIDIPNATLMLIEGADRFGLAQLHQFRGRVGRGEHPSTCYLLADDPSEEAIERLSIVERTRDGFELAEADMQLRGAGELFGTRQSGVPTLRVASLLDARLIDVTRREAERLLDADPELTDREHVELRLLALRIADGVVDEAH